MTEDSPTDSPPIEDVLQEFSRIQSVFEHGKATQRDYIEKCSQDLGDNSTGKAIRSTYDTWCLPTTDSEL